MISLDVRFDADGAGFTPEDKGDKKLQVRLYSETVQFKCKEAARIIQIQRLVQIQIHGIISHL